jgi:putative transposase
MHQHAHLFITPRKSCGADKLRKRLEQRYVQYLKYTYRRIGTQCVDRFRSCLTRDEAYVLYCRTWLSN